MESENMEEELYFKCPDCKRQVKLRKGDEVPECCYKQMEPVPLEPCLTAPSAEHSRPMDDEEPCDDSGGS